MVNRRMCGSFKDHPSHDWEHAGVLYFCNGFMGGLWRRENDAKDVVVKPHDIPRVFSDAVIPLVAHDDPESYGKLTMNRGPVEHIIRAIRNIEEQHEIVKVEVYFL